MNRLMSIALLGFLASMSLGALSLRELIDAIKGEDAEKVQHILLRDEEIPLVQRDAQDHDEQRNPPLSEDGKRVLHVALAIRNPVILRKLLVYVTRFINIDLVQNIIAQTTAPYIVGVHPGHVVPLYQRQVRTHLVPEGGAFEEEYGYRYGNVVLDLDWQEPITHQEFKKLYIEKLSEMSLYAVVETSGHLYFFDGDEFERWRYQAYASGNQWTNPITRTVINVGTERELGNVLKYQFKLYSDSDFVLSNAVSFAVSNYQNDIARLIIDYFIGFDINALNERGGTLLYVAAFRGNAGAVDILLDKPGIDINKINSLGETPLMVAAENGYVSIVTKLLGRGANVWAKDINDKTVFDRAVQGGHLPVVRALLRYLHRYYQTKPQFQRRVFHIKKRMLFYATWAGYKDIVKTLLDSGISANVYTDNQSTPLHYAAFHGRDEVADVLLTDGRANVNTPDVLGDTPLMIAAKQGHLDVVDALLVAGANVNRVDRSGHTALLYAVANNHAEIALHLLAVHGIDVNKGDRDGVTPLMLAVQNNNPEVVRALLAAPGIRINQKNKYGYTALMNAATKGYIDLAGMLLEYGAQPQLHAQNGDTALSLAVQHDHDDIARLLRERQ